MPRMPSWIESASRPPTLAYSVCTLNHATCSRESHIQGNGNIFRHILRPAAAGYGIHWMRASCLVPPPQNKSDSALYVILLTSQRSRYILQECLHKSDATTLMFWVARAEAWRGTNGRANGTAINILSSYTRTIYT